jgi:hypothetical protein
VTSPSARLGGSFLRSIPSFALSTRLWVEAYPIWRGRNPRRCRTGPQPELSVILFNPRTPGIE